jgi:predicted nucleic acid-binding protein
MALSKDSDGLIDKLLENVYYLSVINRIELLGFKGLNQNETKAFELFVNNSRIIDLDEDVVIETIRLRKEYSIKLPDAIIVATCMVNAFTLISNNTRDFEKINGLKIHSV